MALLVENIEDFKRYDLSVLSDVENIVRVLCEVLY